MILNKMLAGSNTRKSRLHTEKGQFVPFSRLIRNGPRAVATGIGRLVFGVRPMRPWISYDAQKLLAAILTPQSTVLEFGSGMSTLWYARHAKGVVSIEDHSEWYSLVKGVLTAQANVEYHFANSVDEYLTFPHQEYDLIMVDGSHRAECVEAALPFLAPGGVIYLDNSDKRKHGLPGDVPKAERLILEYASKRGCEVRRFVDFAPTQLFVQEGVFVRRPT